MRGIKGNDSVQEQWTMLGHELRNVLNGMQGACELLSRSGLNAEQQQWLDSIHQSGHQLACLLEAARPRDGFTHFPFAPVPVRVNGVDLLEMAIRCHTAAATSRKNLLLLNIEPDLSAWWHTDPLLLRLVLDNLLGNAIKFTRGGLIVVEVMPSGKNHLAASGVELRVSDSGPGISRQDRLTVFDHGVQCRNGREREGSGLGLYICRRVVAELKGEIFCESSQSEGACFRVILPAVIRQKWNSISRRESRLFSRMTCTVTASRELCGSLESLLARLGVRPGASAPVSTPSSETGPRLHIRQMDYSSGMSRVFNGLRLTHQMPSGHGAQAPASRFLQAPYLQSTLGPLLMEMALDWRISSISPGQETPRRDEKPG
jgi:anti-sigma regulatory factor (Ser/Thr protein kinase)